MLVSSFCLKSERLYYPWSWLELTPCSVCICAIGGALTPETVVQLTQTISASGGILRSLVNFLGGVTTVTTQVLANALPIVSFLLGTEARMLTPQVLQTPNLCDFPANSIPNECGGCGFGMSHLPCTTGDSNHYRVRGRIQ